MVTLSGSPPNLAMLVLVHSSAATRSRNPWPHHHHHHHHPHHHHHHLVPRGLGDAEVCEAEGPEPVVGLHEHHAPLHPVVGPVGPPRVVARLEIAAEYPEHHRQLGPWHGRRSHLISTLQINSNISFCTFRDICRSVNAEVETILRPVNLKSEELIDSRQRVVVVAL